MADKYLPAKEVNQMNDDKKMSFSPVEIEKYLGGLEFPALKKEIVEKIKSNTDDQSIISLAEDLPDQRYDSPNDIWRELGKMGEKESGTCGCC